MNWLQSWTFFPRCVYLRLGALASLQDLGRHASSAVKVQVNQNEANGPQPREFRGTIKQIKSSPMKLNLVAKLIRGMAIADALAQIQFCEKKAAKYVEMVLLNTQRKAVQRYEADPRNLWVAESFVGKGQYFKKIRYHGKGMHGIMHLYHAHYFIKLREGKPPKKKKHIEDSWKYRTRKYIQAGPRSIPNSL